MKKAIHSLAAFVLALSFSMPAAAAGEADKPAPSKAAAEREAKPAAPMSQQEKMKACNAQAAKKQLKGDERRAFMSSCLKG